MASSAIDFDPKCVRCFECVWVLFCFSLLFFYKWASLQTFFKDVFTSELIDFHIIAAQGAFSAHGGQVLVLVAQNLKRLVLKSIRFPCVSRWKTLGNTKSKVVKHQDEWTVIKHWGFLETCASSVCGLDELVCFFVMFCQQILLPTTGKVLLWW